MSTVKKKSKRTARAAKSTKISKGTAATKTTKQPATQLQPIAQPAVAVPAAAAAESAPHAMPSAVELLRTSLRFWRREWRFITLFVLLYIVLSLVFVHNFASGVTGLKSQLTTLLHGNQALTGLSAYALLVTTTSTATGASAVYQYVLLTLFSLAFIWALRQSLSQRASGSLRLRNSFYEGMYPLVPFLLVVIVLALELLPVAAGGSLVGTVLANGIAVTTIEHVLWGGVFVVCAGLSLWLLTFSIFALYIVTLPGGRPWQSLKDAKRITAGRRLVIIRKLLFLVCVVLLVGAVIVVPVIILVAPLTSVILFVLGALALPFAHTYLYGLYRELLA